MTPEFAIIGKRLPRADAIEKATGEVRFMPDIQLPGMLFAKFLRSPYAHAKITRIDTSKAEALSGVKAILTHKNVPHVRSRIKFGFILDETMHFAGEEVAAVAAVTEEVAEEALGLIEVEYEPLPAVFTAEEAMRPGAPLVYPEYGSNVYHGTPESPVLPRCKEGRVLVENEDIEKGFAAADHVIQDVYETPMQYPCSPAPRTVVCEWYGNKLTCWCDTQTPLRAWQDLARCLGMPQSYVRLINHCVGSYGAKEPTKMSVLTALLAKKAGKPVKSQFSREEDFIATHRRLNYRTDGKIGVKTDGTITAVSNNVISNMGADSQVALEVMMTSAANSFSVLYDWQSSRVEGYSILTNTLHHAAMLGFGDPEAILCLERMIDETAEKISMDPVEFRLKNCGKYGSKGIFWPSLMNSTGPINWGVKGQDIDSFPVCIQRVAEKAGWREKWRGWRKPMAAEGPRMRGIGVALGMHHTVYTDYSAIVKMNQDGTANVLSGSVELGQGGATAIIQVVAETLGLPPNNISVVLGDTAVTPAGMGNVGSCGVSSAVAAVKYAADDARRKLLEVAARVMLTSTDVLEIRDRKIQIKGNPAKSMPVSDACRIGFQIIGSANNPPANTIRDSKTGKIIYPYAIAAGIIEVSVDIETGELVIDNITIGADCGRAINPTIVENQIDMSATLGNGYVRTESLVIDGKTGVLLNPNLLDYKIMTIADMPTMANQNEIIVEKPCAWGPYGAKGFSESPMSPIGPAIANAIYNAIGVRIRGPNYFPETILAALGKIHTAKTRPV